MRDFFISYNSADKPWAEWIAWQLEEAGYSTFLQSWDFRPGRNFVLDMQQAAKEAARTIAVLSSNYINAQYTQPEWAAAFAQDPMGTKGIVLPVRIEACKLEGLLSQIVYIDLVGLSQEAAKIRLLEGLNQGRVKPVIAPVWPLGEPQQPSSPGVKPPLEIPAAPVQTPQVPFPQVVTPTPPPAPMFPDPQLQPLDPDELEDPEGVVALDSPFYIERHEDKRFKRQLSKAGTTTTVIGTRQMGKTSLLIRGIEAARENNFSVLYFDFQIVETASLQELDGFLRHLALNIAIQFKISRNNVEAVWQIPLGPKERLTRFIEDYLLKDTVQPIVLAIDEADRLAESNFRREFFSLVRAWHNMRGFNSLWTKFSVAMVISTQPSLLIDDVNQSPFNVGTQIRLRPFTLEQIQELNKRHGSPLRDAEISEMMDLLGGLPYLVRKAFFTLIDEAFTWSQLMAEANFRDGPFSTHLHQYGKQLRDLKLVEAIKSILKTGTCEDKNAVNRLISGGLITEAGSSYRFQCRLYDSYFRGIF